MSERQTQGSMWWATLAALGIVIAGGVVLALAAPRLTGAVGDSGRLVIGLILTIIPAVLWLLVFYQQDRLEPEPHHYVLGVFVLGALLGGALEQPLLRDIFQVQLWVQPGSAQHLPVAVLLNGILTAALTYAAVRFSVMPTAEFDERVDGMIYGTAAALGLGVSANLNYLIEHGTISLGVGALTIIITSLAYATFGAILGYFLGLIKPGGGPGWLAPLGVLVAGLLQGLYLWLSAQLQTGVLSYNPWPGLIVTALFAGLMFGLAFYLIQRSYHTPPALPVEGGA